MKKSWKTIIWIVAISIVTIGSLSLTAVLLTKNYQYQDFIIEGDDELAEFCVEGEGTLENPFIIENYIITRFQDFGISLSDISYHVIIRNCVISDDDKSGTGINIYQSSWVNISNCLIYNCLYGIKISFSNNLAIFQNEIKQNTLHGLYMNYDSECNVIFNNSLSENGQSGIYVSSSASNNTISHNICSQNGEGISISFCDQNPINYVTDNLCNDNQYGISIWRSKSLVANNTCSNNLVGIYIFQSNVNSTNNFYNENEYGVFGGYVENSHFYTDNFIDNRYAVDVEISENITFQNNTFIHGSVRLSHTCKNIELDSFNTLNGKSILYYENQTGLVISNLQNVSQILLMRCEDSLVEFLNFSQVSGAIELYDSSNITIRYNNFTDNDAGIYLDNSGLNNISDNTFTSNNLGVYSHWSCPDNFYSNNTMNGCGFFVTGSSSIIDPSNTVNGKPVLVYSDMDDLELSSNQNAGQIILISCHNAVIRNQHISNTSVGLLMNYCENAEITGNKFTNNFYGLYFTFVTRYNLVWNNSFIDNYYQTEILGYGNEFDNGVIGNFWSDMKIQNPNAIVMENGLFWNSHYAVNLDLSFQDIIDHHPLACPFGIVKDTDNDGIFDSIEQYNIGTDHTNSDTDGDGMDDKWEIDNRLDPFTNDTDLDPDNDGLSNLDEYVYDTNPQISRRRVEFFATSSIFVLVGVVATLLYYRSRRVKKNKD